MYGQYLALNHLIATNQLNVVKLEKFIDFPSDKNDTINDKIHIHVYHNDGLFSKFEFKEGLYSNMTIPQVNFNQIKFYCLKMALESQRFSHQKLFKMFQIEFNKKY